MCPCMARALSVRALPAPFDCDMCPLTLSQGMFCGRTPKDTSASDEETRTMDVKLRLLSGFKRAKITYYPDTTPVRDIVKKVSAMTSREYCV